MLPRIRPLLVAALLAFAPAVASAAPTPTVELGAPYKVIDAPMKQYFHIGGSVYALKIDGDDATIQRFAVDGLKEVSRVEAELPNGWMYETLTVVDGRAYLLYSLWDRKSTTEQLFAWEITAEGAFAPEPRRIVAVQGKIAGNLSRTGFYSFNVTDKFRISRSADEKTMVVRYRRKPEVRDDSVNKDVLGLWVFGPGLAEQWHRELEMPYTEEKMDFWDEGVDSQGNAYILAKVREGDGSDERKKDEDIPNYHGEIFQVSPTSTEVRITPFGVADKFISSAGLYEVPGRGMVVAGAYNAGRTLAAADGLYTARIGADGRLEQLAFHEIPIEILKQNASAREARRAERKEKKGDPAELAALTMRWMLVDPDGSITLIGEQYWIQVIYYQDSQGRMQTRYVYHYDDMLMARVDAAGKLAWMRRLPKSQAGAAGQGGMSFARFSSDGAQYLVFLDNIKNLDLPPDKEPALHQDGQGGFLTAYKVTDSGDVSRISILDTRDVQDIELFQLGVNRIVGVGPHTFVMEAYKKKKQDILVRVELE